MGRGLVMVLLLFINDCRNRFDRGFVFAAQYFHLMHKMAKDDALDRDGSCRDRAVSHATKI